jgi:hypothetical protein
MEQLDAAPRDWPCIFCDVKFAPYSTETVNIDGNIYCPHCAMRSGLWAHSDGRFFSKIKRDVYLESESIAHQKGGHK